MPATMAFQGSRVKPRIIALTNCFVPGFLGGGPVRSLHALATVLWEEFDFRVVTADRDIGGSHPYAGIKLEQWTDVGVCQVQYLPPPPRHWVALWRILNKEPWDVLYINDFFSLSWGILPLILNRASLSPRRSILVAPRGQFAPGALGNKTYKKSGYLALAKRLGLFSGLTWHATNETEAAEIRNIAGQEANIVTASNVPNIDLGIRKPAELRYERDGSLRLVFVSRIASKKNLAYAMRVLTRVRAPVTFDIYGPIEDEKYWRNITSIVDRLPRNIQVAYKGVLSFREAHSIYHAYDCLFLPTLGENFGHVIYESLCAGCPVIISDRTPWRNLESEGCGWDIPLEDEVGFVQAVHQLHSMSYDDRLKMRRRAHDHAASYVANSNVVHLNKRMFQEVSGKLEHAGRGSGL